MNYFSLFIITIMLFLSSCTVSQQQAYEYKSRRSIVTYDLSNPIVLEKSARGLNILSILPPPSTLGEGTIAVRSIESDINNHLDDGVIYMIEDNLITLLIESGYNVVERDPDALGNLYRESDLKFKKANPKYKKLNSINNLDKLAGPNIEARGSVINENSNSQAEYIETQINSATYILSYRVLECGVVYNEIANKSDVLDRSSRTRLHCRLTNTKTSKIYAAGLLENEFNDVVYASDVKNLQQISYKYYDHTLPLQSNDEDAANTIKVNKGTTHTEVIKTDIAIEEPKPKVEKDSGKYSLTKWLSIPVIALIFGSD